MKKNKKFITTGKYISKRTKINDYIKHKSSNKNILNTECPVTFTRVWKGQMFGININALENKLEQFVINNGRFINKDLSNEYLHYFIPKRSGGKREIHDPKSELRLAHNDLRDILVKDFCISHSRDAYAYIKKIGTKNFVKQHKKSNMNLRVAFDFKDFFGSINIDFTYRMLMMQFPFFLLSENGKDNLKKALSICFLNGGLPQGTTISPVLTNAIMIPFDYYMHYKCNTHQNGHYNATYTRYADDISISIDNNYVNTDRNSFRIFCENMIKHAIEWTDAPIRLNYKKTKIRTDRSPNWMLGIMLNSNNRITIGHDKKRYLKAMTWKYLNRDMNHEEIMKYKGLISYYRHVEGIAFAYWFRNVIGNQCLKLNINVNDRLAIIKELLSKL